MNTRIRIDLSKGVIDVEGDGQFVREVYSDFRDSLIRKIEEQELPSDEKDKSDQDSSKKKKGVRRRPSSQKQTTKNNEDNQPDPDNPRLDKELDLSQLSTFYCQFEPANNPERILVFCKFLKTELGLDTINTDHIFSCYMALKERVPEAFKQSFRDAQGNRYGFINFSGSLVSVTVTGENHFNQNIKRRESE